MFHCYFLITRYSLCSARQGSKTQTTAAVLLQTKPQPHQIEGSPAQDDHLSSQSWQSTLHPGKREQLYILSGSVIRPKLFQGNLDSQLFRGI